MQSFTFATLASAAVAIGADKLDFANYAARFNKFYENIEEFMARFERFGHHHRLICEHNTSGSKNFKLGYNQFSDWTEDEYLAILTYGFSSNENEKRSAHVFKSYYDLPNSVDWVKAGFDGPVKD